MNEISMSSKGQKGGSAQCLQDAERNPVYLGRFKPGCFMYIVPGSEETWKFERYPDNLKGKLDELAKQVTDVYLAQKHSILKGCRNLQKGNLKRDGANMHVNASEASKWRIMDLTSSANDICILSWKVKQGRS